MLYREIEASVAVDEAFGISAGWPGIPIFSPAIMNLVSPLAFLALVSSGCVHAQLNTLAMAAGKKYFGTATDNPELSDAAYVTQLGNKNDFHQLTPVCINWAYHIRQDDENMNLHSRQIA